MKKSRILELAYETAVTKWHREHDLYIEAPCEDQWERQQIALNEVEEISKLLVKARIEENK